MFSEIRLAARSLLRSPGFLLVAVVTLALGVGSVSSIYSVLRGTLLQPLPYPEPHELVAVNRVRPPASGPVSKPVYTAWREGSGAAFEALGAFTRQAATFAGDGEAERVPGVRVTPEFWTALGVAPHRGRWWGAQEEASDARVAVLSHALWQRRFNGDESIVGRDVQIDGEAVRVIGIAPQTLRYPSQAFVYRPTYLPSSNVGPGRSFLTVVGRLAPGVTREQALAALQPVNAALEQADPPNNRNFQAEVVDLGALLNANARQPLMLLMAASALVLLIGCANLANLLMARASQRQRSLAVRSALGASRAALLRLTLTEAAIIALVGGGLGVALAALAVPLFLRGADALLPSHAQASVNLSVIVASLAATLATVLMFALWPALRAARATPASALQQEARGAVGRSRSRSQRLLIAFEVALSLTLLTGAGLLLESLRRSAGQDLGVRTDNVLIAAVGFVHPAPPPGTESEQQQVLRAQYDNARLVPLLERLRALPGVQSVAAADAVPTQAINQEISSVMFPGRPAPPEGSETPWVNGRYVSASYFPTLGIELKRGEMFRDDENAPGATPRRVLVNETFVQRFLPGEDPIGVQIENVGDGGPTVIAGVVADARSFGPEQEVPAEAYLPLSSLHASQVMLALRVQGDPAALAPLLRRTLQEFDPGMPILQLRPLAEAVAETDPFRQFNLDLMLAFSGVALLLTAFGVYAVIAYLVAQRRAELGIRMSMGADGGRIVRHVLAQGMAPVAFGVAIGLVGAVLLGQALSSQLFGLGRLEPGVLGGVVGMLVGVALLATVVPAWRATRIPAVEVLRGA